MLVREKRSSRGISVIEVVVVSFLIGVAGIYAADMLSHSFKGQSRLGLVIDRDATKMMLLGGVSCADTIALSPCPASGPVNLYRTNGNTPVVFVSGTLPATKIGDFTVKAECAANGAGYVVRLARISEPTPNPALATPPPFNALTTLDNTSYRPDPGTKRITKWNDASSLAFPEGLTLCAGLGGFSVPPAAAPSPTPAIIPPLPTPSPTPLTAAPPSRYLSTVTQFSANTPNSVTVATPPGVAVIRVHGIGHNLATYIVSGVNYSPLTEDYMDLDATIDVVAAKSTGIYSVIAGSSNAFTILFVWNNQPLNATSVQVVGDTSATSLYAVNNYASFRPVFNYNASSNSFTMSSLSLFSPAQYAWKFDFYGN